MMEEFDDMIPVTCDKNPPSLVSWYNTKTKKIVSREIYSANPESQGDHVRISKQGVEKFYAKAKESLKAFTQIINEAIEKITQYSSDELNLGASDFLKMSSQIRKICSYFADYT